MQLSRTQEEYLYIIHKQVETSGYARICDIAGSLGVRPSSANQMIARLSAMGLVDCRRYCPVRLTDEGAAIAKVVKTRHQTFRSFFDLLALPEHIIKKDSLKIEQNLHPETVHRMSRFIEYLVRNGLAEEIKKEFANTSDAAAAAEHISSEEAELF